MAKCPAPLCYAAERLASGRISLDSDAIAAASDISGAHRAESEDHPEIFFRPHWGKPLILTLPTVHSAQSPQATRR